MNKDSKKTQIAKNANITQLQGKPTKKRGIKIGELKYIEVNDVNSFSKANKKISKRNTKNNSPSSFIQNQTECVSLRTNYNTIVNTQYHKKNSSNNVKKIKHKLVNYKLGKFTKLQTINVNTSNISLNHHVKPKSSSSINKKPLFLENGNNKLLNSKKVYYVNTHSLHNKTQNSNNKVNSNFQNFKNNTKLQNSNTKNNNIKNNNTYSLTNKNKINPEISENNLSNNVTNKKQNMPIKKKINMKKYYSNNTLISPFNKNKFILSNNNNNHIIPCLNTEPYKENNENIQYVKVNLKEKKLYNKNSRVEEFNRKNMHKKFYNVGNNQKFENCIGVTSIVINNNPYCKNSRNKSCSNNSEIKYCDININSKISSTVNKNNNKLNNYIQINNIGGNKILINRKIKLHNSNDKYFTVLHSPNAHEVRKTSINSQNYNDVKKIIYENYKIKEDNDYLNDQINNMTKEFENMKKENIGIRKELQEKSKMIKDMKLTIDIFSRELNKLQTISENSREKYFSNRNNNTIIIDIESPQDKNKIKEIKTINDKYKKNPLLNSKNHA